MNKSLKTFRNLFGGGVLILVAVVAIFVVTHIRYYMVIHTPMKEDRQAHVANSIYSFFGKFSYKLLSNDDALECALYFDTQNITENADSSYAFCKNITEDNEDIIATMIEYRPGVIHGQDNYFAPSYIDGKCVDQASLPLEDRIWPGRNIEDSVWQQGLDPFIEGPVYSPACGCNILMISVPRFDAKGMFSIFSSVVNLDKEIEYLKSHNPYPEGKFYVINEDDLFVINDDIESGSDVSAFEWLKENYGDSAISLFEQSEQDAGIHYSNIAPGEPYYFSSYDIYDGFFFFYAIPSEYLVQDVNGLFHKILLIAFIGALLIIVICILNIYFVGRIRAHESAIEKEIETAAKIQKSMLIAPTDLGDGCKVDAILVPAKHVGGDLYCYFRNEGKLFFCIGDVAGKGVPAAMHMSKCISLFRNISRYCSTAESIIEQLNAEMCANNGECVFVSVFIGVLDLKTGELDYCNAGHERPLYWDGKASDKPYFVELVSENIVLGVVEDFKFKTGKFIMEKGSVLMQFTDGVDEAVNEKSQLFGKERFQEVFSQVVGSPLSDINDAVVSRIATFAGRNEQSDDITLLTIKYNGMT